MAPWPTDEQIEQDLIISRALCEIYRDAYLSERLAFRGGTALHKLYLSPALRYSEDIDLVQITAEPIKTTIQALQKCLSFLGDASIQQKRDNNTLIYRVAQLRFLSVIAGEPNRIFFTGDLGQRIFQQPFSWKSLGVDIRGRSKNLHINYRTDYFTPY
jgi:hypothetical protein